MITLEQFEEKLPSVSLVQLANDAKHAAVWDSKHYVLLGSFWEAGQNVVVPAWGGNTALTVNANQAVLLVGRLDTWTWTVVDPTQMLTSVTISLSFSSSKHLPAKFKGSKTRTLRVTFGTGELAGKGVTVNL
jgi:hypothetical protein